MLKLNAGTVMHSCLLALPIEQSPACKSTYTEAFVSRASQQCSGLACCASIDSHVHCSCTGHSWGPCLMNISLMVQMLCRRMRGRLCSPPTRDSPEGHHAADAWPSVECSAPAQLLSTRTATRDLPEASCPYLPCLLRVGFQAMTGNYMRYCAFQIAGDSS